MIDDTRNKPQCGCADLTDFQMTKYDPATAPPLDKQAQDVEIANALIEMKGQIDKILRVILGS